MRLAWAAKSRTIWFRKGRRAAPPGFDRSQVELQRCLFGLALALFALPHRLRQPLGIGNSRVAQRHQVIPELTFPFLRGQTEHGADHWQTVSLPGPHDFISSSAARVFLSNFLAFVIAAFA